MRKIISILLTLAMILPMVAVPVKAAPTPVNDFAELKAAIESAVDGDEITVTSDIELLEALVISGKTITISGNFAISAGSQVSVADSAANPNVKNTLFAIKDSTVTFDGLTLDGKNQNRIIYSEGSKLTLTGAKVTNGCPGDNSTINPGGGIFLRGGSLTATNTVFSNNKPGSAIGLQQGDGDLNGGAIYSGGTKADITITGGSFVDNEVKAYGHGAAIYQENGILNINGTAFKNNKGHVEGGNAGTQGVCIHIRQDVTANISNVDVTVAKGFNTGGFLRSLGSDVTVANSEFKIENLGDGYGYSGGVLCFENGKSKVEGSTFTCTGSKLYHAGGFIDIVGGGEHIIDRNTMTGSGNDNNSAIASFGGAISVEQGAKATVTIKGNTITNSTASDNGGAIAIGTHKGVDTPSTVTMSGNKISNSGLIMWKGGAGGAVFVGKGSTVTVSGDEIKDTKAPYGGGIYNEGNLTINGGSTLTGGIALSLGGEIYNNGDLTVDDATVKGNFVGPANWNQTPGHNKASEYGGTNIYAEKDVTITPQANIQTGKDVRVIDGKSKILLTGGLANQIDVSVSEVPATGEKPFESVNRRIGYVVAEGTGYTVTKSDANFLHYLSRAYDKNIDASDDNQPIAEANDDTSTGMWDFVLDKDNSRVVLGQRVKLIYHGNLGKLGSKDKEEKTVDVYKTPEFWEGQLDEYKVDNPTRENYDFMGWYYWKDQTAGDTETGIQNITKPDDLKDNLFDFSKVTFQNNVADTDKIITPNVINTYAGWSKNIDINIEKTWEGAEESDKQNISVTLYDGTTSKETKTFDNSTSYGGKFENLPVFTKSYEGEEKNMNLRFAPKVYKVEEAALDGFTTSYNPATITANSDVEKKITITNKKTYKVKYAFISGTSGKTLPEVVTSQLPKEETGKANGASVSPSTSTFNSVADGNGTWTFTSWDKQSDTINKADVIFTGTWTYSEEPEETYKVKYAFISGTSDKTLPSGVTDQLPKEETGKANGASVSPSTSTFNSVVDGNGTWTFTSWDKTTDTINKADVTFTGTWTFAEKEEPVSKYRAKYEFKSGTEGKILPTEIEGFKPTDNTEYEDGATVNAKEPTQKTFEDTTNNGTWTFTKWDANSKTVEGSDVTFTGTWTFAKKEEPQPEPQSDFSITKTVDKQTYEKVGDVLKYTVTVKNTGEKKLENLTITDSLVGSDKLGDDTTFTLDVNEEKTFTYTYTVTEDDVKAKSITNIASVKLGDDGKPKTSTTTSKLKEPQPEPKPEPKPEPYDPGYRYEPSPKYLKDEPKAKPIEEKPIEEKPIERPELNKDDHKIYMFGYPDWTFKPEGEMTRGEAAAMFARLFKEYPGDNYNYHEDFSDVDENYWCYKEIAYLAEWGIINGYEDGTFKPDNKISRAEFVKIVESFEALQTGANPYSDVTETYWAYKYIVSSSAKGWINGYLDGTFKPDNNISRSEAVKIANKLVNRHPDKDFIDRNKYLLKDFTDLPTSHWAYYEIHEAANGHIFERLANGMDERWLEVNEDRFVFTPPKYHYNK